MFATLAIAVLSILPQQDVLRDYVAHVETNAFYDENGRLVFVQNIFSDFNAGRYDVVAWRLVKETSQLPQRDWEQGGYVVRWVDGETIREVRTPSVSESWTSYDVELAAREVLAKELRRELRNYKAVVAPAGGGVSP